MIEQCQIPEDMQEKFAAIKSAIDLRDEAHVVLFVNQNPQLCVPLYNYAKTNQTSTPIRNFLESMVQRMTTSKPTKS